jgi:4-deoxy-L-threo-5-hexosulose-uronate ketol-isomerase
MGAGDVVFESVDVNKPAKYYLVSTPAHATYETTKISKEKANSFKVGEQGAANKRTISQYIIPGVCQSCQLVMGLTQLEPGSMWNTMPCHTHDRRSEVYLYFDLEGDARVVHLMGQPNETRHLVVANEQAVLSPGWSIHSGVGTSHYAFIWAMGGDNQDYTDMDMVDMSDLR